MKCFNGEFSSSVFFFKYMTITKDAQRKLVRKRQRARNIERVLLKTKKINTVQKQIFGLLHAMLRLFFLLNYTYSAIFMCHV